MPGRRYSEGLHQAIEAKERVQIQRESVTLATITFQNYFRLYEKISGMTGTAATEAEEFHKIYKLDVLTIPTHRDNKRNDLADRLYKTELAKFHAVVKEVKERHQKGQPVLVGTSSIEKNEVMHLLLQQAGVPHEVLNAKNHEKEAQIIAQAGRKGAVTIATNMAGRGVDIILGGNPQAPVMAEEIRAMGGLCVIGTERHESRRIDNQLRGRAGRQGDPGTTRFYVSMEDDLMRIFGSDRMKSMMDTLRLPDDEAIENRFLSKSIETAQRKVEGHHFDIRKHLLEYDDVLNKHRGVFYRKREEFLIATEAPTEEGERQTKAVVLAMFDREIDRLLARVTPVEEHGTWDLATYEDWLKMVFPANVDLGVETVKERVAEAKDPSLIRGILEAHLKDIVQIAYKELESLLLEPSVVREVEKAIVLRTMDDAWILHLEAMDHLRHGIGLQGYGQRDPLVVYKREGHRLFTEFQSTIDARVTMMIFKVSVQQNPPATQTRTA